MTRGTQVLMGVVLAATGVAEAARIMAGAEDLASNGEASLTMSGSTANLSVGHLLHGRFRLARLIDTNPMFGRPVFFPSPVPGTWGPAPGPWGHGHGHRGGVVHRPGAPQSWPGAVKRPSEKPGEEFPQGTLFGDQSPHHLGAGQFGDVWEAQDTTTGETVAVKVFYTRTSPTSKEYITWNTADQSLKDEMNKNIQECRLVQDIIQQGKDRDPVGASRICECKEEGISQGKTNKDSVMYTVWEMCGQDLTKFRQDMAALPADRRLEVARTLTRQVLEAIRLLNIFKPALIHHDMKADNAVVLGDVDSGLSVKLIDFGCFVQASPDRKYSQTTGDPKYMPPEHSQYKAFEDPPSSFDIYGAGLVHMELLCPALEDKDWCPLMRPQHNIFMPGLRTQSSLSMDAVSSGIEKRCPEMANFISEDLHAIGMLTDRSPGNRPLPADALALEAFAASSNEPAVEPVTDQPPPHVDESIRVPVVPMIFDVGDKVEYHSETKDEWLKCRITAVNDGGDGQGSYDLSGAGHQYGAWVKSGVAPETVRMRSFTQGDLVLFADALAATVEEYDEETETYTLTLPGGQTIQSHRDDVQPRPLRLEEGSAVMFADFSSFQFIPAEVQYYNAVRDTYELKFSDDLEMRDVPANLVAAAQ